MLILTDIKCLATELIKQSIVYQRKPVTYIHVLIKVCSELTHFTRYIDKVIRFVVIIERRSWFGGGDWMLGRVERKR